MTAQREDLTSHSEHLGLVVVVDLFISVFIVGLLCISLLVVIYKNEQTNTASLCEATNNKKQTNKYEPINKKTASRSEATNNKPNNHNKKNPELRS